jgi:KDO2-lipid IV(A) lauroyltransferase
MYYIYTIARILAKILPRRLGYFIALICSRIKFYCSFKDKHIVYNNLLGVLGSPSASYQCTKRVFDNFSYYLVDFFRFSLINKKFVDKYVRIENRHKFTNIAQDPQRGVIIVSAHIGNYEFGAGVTSMLGHSVNAIALPHIDQRVNDFFIQQRHYLGVETIRTGIPAKRCLQLLKNKGVVAFVADRNFSKGNVQPVTICGKKTVLPKGPAFFAQKTGAYLIPTFAIREDKYYYRLIFEDPILPEIDGKLKTDEQLIGEYAKIFEKYIRLYPDQWYIFQKYWIDEE